MRYGSVCGGIHTYGVAWHSLGNAWAVPVAQWVMKRLLIVDRLLVEKA